MTEEIKQYLDRIASYEEYSPLHEYRNEWIYFITDEINDDLAKATLYDELKIQHVEIMNELKFIERMMEISGGAKIVTEEKKPDIASMIAQIDADGDIEIEEYVVEKNIFFSSVKEFFTDIKGLFRKGNKNECI